MCSLSFFSTSGSSASEAYIRRSFSVFLIRAKRGSYRETPAHISRAAAIASLSVAMTIGSFTGWG